MTEQAPGSPPPPPSVAKSRHGCLSLYLALVFAFNPFEVYRLATHPAPPGTPAAHAPLWTLIALIALLLLNILFAVALLRWKRWGYYGLVCNAMVFFAVNVSRGGRPLFAAMVGFFAIAVLSVAVNVGGSRRAWPQLE